MKRRRPKTPSWATYEVRIGQRTFFSDSDPQVSASHVMISDMKHGYRYLPITGKIFTVKPIAREDFTSEQVELKIKKAFGIQPERVREIEVSSFNAKRNKSLEGLW